MAIVANDFLSRISIEGAYKDLGGPALRSGRGKAFWRDGTHFSVALDRDHGLWFDHADGCGGGILDLAQKALGCDRAQAIEWARDYAGVPRPEWSLEQKSEYARRRAAAEDEAQALVAWRERMTEAVRGHRDLALQLYHATKNAIVHADYRSDNELGELMEEAELAETAYLRDDAILASGRSASWATWLAVYRKHGREA